MAELLCAQLGEREAREQRSDLHSAIVHHRVQLTRSEAALPQWRRGHRARVYVWPMVAQLVEKDVEEVGGGAGTGRRRVHVSVGRWRKDHLRTDLAFANALDVLEKLFWAHADPSIAGGKLALDLGLDGPTQVANGSRRTAALSLGDHCVDHEFACDRVKHARVRHVANENRVGSLVLGEHRRDGIIERLAAFKVKLLDHLQSLARAG
mmetsp:Transcript_58955/g.117130  ORF Transcript_58955/g.117130 Transcript_58955/m.117130 type:complete len:208 (-) Transcript_58955:6901-7524(-)